MAEFTFYGLIKEFGYIEIPALQRDYAQGRRDEKEVRNSFLSYLKNMLEENASDTLDFIYGTVDDKPKKLVLVDGQQRMTTLFLLYWYLAAVNGEEECHDFQKNMLEGDFSRFRYETRYSSREFCNQLVSNLNKIDASLFENRTVSDVIIDQKWFQKQWINDSTVKSMLVMLDAMQRMFPGLQDNLYERLEHVFKVDFLNLDEFSINDAGKLYIKMNSRGKPLTRFENLKSMLLSYISTKTGEGMDYESLMHSSFYENASDLEGLSFSDKAGWLLDIRWTDAIWGSLGEEDKKVDTNNTDPLLDRILLNLVVLPLMNECCVSELENPDDEVEPIDRSYISSGVDKLPFDSIFRALDDYDKDGDILSGMINFLDGITFYDSNSRSWQLRSNLGSYEWLRFGNRKYFQDLFMTIKEKKLELSHILKLHALYLFIRIYGNSYDLEMMKDWLRFSSNVIDATILNSTEIVYSLSSLTLLCHQFPTLDGTVIKGETYRGLDSLQIEEEVEKRRLAEENSECGEEILSAEEKLFGYFNGQLRYPLSYSKLLGSSCTPEALDDFRNACEVLFSLFIEYPDKREYTINNLLTRAMLTKGEYMVPVKRNGVRSFLSLSDRDYSWRRYLKEHGSFFSSIVDEIIKSGNADISTSLEAIIAGCNLDAEPSWKRILIGNPRIWGKVRYLGSKNESNIWEMSSNGARNVWIDVMHTPDAWVEPIKGKNHTGAQNELFTLDLCTKLCDADVDVSPFAELAYYRGKLNQAPSCTVLNDWIIGDGNFAIDIFRKDAGDAIFVVRFFERNGKEIPKEIAEVLSEFEMTLTEHNDYRTEWKWAGNECIIQLEKLLPRLSAIDQTLTPSDPTA